MKKYLLVILLLLLPISVRAIGINPYCSPDELNNSTDYTYNVAMNYFPVINEENDTVYYNVVISNLTSDMILFFNNKTYRGFNANKTEQIIRVYSGGNYSVQIYSYKCKNEILSKTLKIPVYNKHYKSELCKGLTEYKQCQRWSGYTASDEKFEKDIKAIKEELEKSKPKEEKKKELSTKDKVIKFLKENWWICAIVVVVLLIIITIAAPKKRKSRF